MGIDTDTNTDETSTDIDHTPDIDAGVAVDSDRSGDVDTTTAPSKDELQEERLKRRIEDAEIEGWELDKRQGDRAILKNRSYGSLKAHLLVALLTIWWTLGLGNVIYAAYVYFTKADTKVVRAE